MARLIAKNLAKSYKGRKVVDDVSLEVNSGEIVGLLGPNGAGKTTSFYMIVGLIARDKGSIAIDDNDISIQPMHVRSRLGIGYLPQDASIFRALSVENNIMAVLETRENLSKKQRKDKLQDLLDEFSIDHIRKSLGAAVSGGERRRVEIARALAADPQFILLDEPFAGIDPKSISGIKQMIKHLRDRGLGVLITDHQVKEMLDVCDRTYIVSGGKLIFSGAPEDVITNEIVKSDYLGDHFKL